MELGQRNGEFLSELSFSETGLWSCGTTPLSFLDLSFPEDTWESATTRGGVQEESCLVAAPVRGVSSPFLGLCKQKCGWNGAEL